jgi:hypothetical protein
MTSGCSEPNFSMIYLNEGPIDRGNLMPNVVTGTISAASMDYLFEHWWFFC